MARKREGEVVCRCGAYRFPHRCTGGRCTLARWVRRFFQPHRRECVGCVSYVGGQCEIVAGQENAQHCPELQEFVRFEGIRLYGAARLAFERLR